MLHIHKLPVKDLTFQTVNNALETVEAQPLKTNNWSSQYPYSPEVYFKIAHNGTHLFLKYGVKEKEILAAAKGNNSAVWTDSCVEFFISFDDSGYYYNLEQSCIGQVLLGYRKKKNECVHAADIVINSIERYPSLGYDNFDLRSGDFEWSLLSIIPVEVFWMTKLSTFDGLTAKANFYKCGDNLKTPHFLSWSPIETDAPNFHTPDFFKEIGFNK